MNDVLLTQKLLKRFSTIKQKVPGPRGSPRRRNTVYLLERAERSLKEAVKFKVPRFNELAATVYGLELDANGDIPDVEIPPSDIPTARLPYPKIVLEFRMYDGGPGHTDVVLLYTENEDGTIDSDMFIKSTNSLWSTATLGFKFNPRSNQATTRYGIVYDNSDPESERDFDLEAQLVPLRAFLTLLYDANTEEKQLVVPKRLMTKNRNAEKNLYDYRELVIRPTTKKYVDSAKDTGITRCTHLRRGHYRRYKSGKVVWIEPMMIKPESNKRVMGKHYRLNGETPLKAR